LLHSISLALHRHCIAILALVYRSSAVVTLDVQIRQMVPHGKKRMEAEQERFENTSIDLLKRLYVPQ
jgi:hypothetical protein